MKKQTKKREPNRNERYQELVGEIQEIIAKIKRDLNEAFFAVVDFFKGRR